MKKRILIIVTLLLTIGFSAVATNVILNGNINIGINEEDFAIYFSDAYINGIQKVSVISKDRQTITYTSEVSALGEETILEYEVTNASREYDARVSVECLPKEDEDIKIVNEIENEIIRARSKEVGRIKATLKRESTEEKSKSFTCKLVYTGVEREELDTRELEETCLDMVGRTWEFAYTGNEEEFPIPCSGEYKIELWGSSGKTTSNTSLITLMENSYGLGAYTAGNLNLEKEKSLFVSVGGQLTIFGGGIGEAYGGDATAISLVSATPSLFENLKARIMVAAGGGGGMVNVTLLARGHAGGLTGYAANSNNNNATGYSGYGASQNRGGNTENNGYDSFDATMVGAFGKGGYYLKRSSGGGGGYYGGGHGRHYGASWSGGGGGSSFISGHNGCDAIKEESTENNILHTGQANHYSGYVFTDTVMVDGAGYNWTNTKGAYTGMPTHDGKSTMTGNMGNGYAKITLVSLA